MIVNILWVSVWMVFMVILSEAKVVWEVEKQISEYGEDLELICIADNYNMSSQTSKRWYQGQTLLTFNDASEDNTKYNASLYSNGFKLIIKNLTKNDVNITYMCSDGFDKSENLPLRIEDVFKVQSRVGEEQIPLPTIQPDITDNQQPNRNESSAIVNEADQSCRLPSNGVIVNEADQSCHHSSNGDQYDGIQYHPLQPNISNGTNNQGTNIANRFCHHPSNENIGTSGTPQTSDKSFQPVIVTSFSRIDACKTPQPQQLDDECNETYHVADIDRSIVSPRPMWVVVPDNDSYISNPNQEEEFIISSAKFPAYSKKRVREQSFTVWSLSEPSKQKMASAGFFYKGCNTYAQCFCCGFNQKWTENDDPFSSSLHNDNCSYSEKVNNSSVQDSNSRSPDNEEINPKSME
ncbi:BIRC2_3 [Mytilus edulis]|uniref:BIRC2_3 n=1 Tax=Mytilus edulis TaxID=6550 RepID=A0A8S3RK13_MYTED|nr:BIRC2_3 [Mytilus edulis]